MVDMAGGVGDKKEMKRHKHHTCEYFVLLKMVKVVSKTLGSVVIAERNTEEEAQKHIKRCE